MGVGLSSLRIEEDILGFGQDKTDGLNFVSEVVEQVGGELLVAEVVHVLFEGSLHFVCGGGLGYSKYFKVVRELDLFELLLHSFSVDVLRAGNHRGWEGLGALVEDING